MKRALLLAIIALAAVQPAQAQQRLGWRVKDLLIEVSLVQAAGNVDLSASWASRNAFPEEYDWSIVELGLSGTVQLKGVDLVVPRPDNDLNANFCVKTVRISDSRESAEICIGFQIPGVPVLPPDSVTIQVAIVSAGSNFATARWDTIAGAQEYFVSIESAAGEVGRFPFGYARGTRTVLDGRIIA